MKKILTISRVAGIFTLMLESMLVLILAQLPVVVLAETGSTDSQPAQPIWENLKPVIPEADSSPGSSSPSTTSAPASDGFVQAPPSASGPVAKIAGSASQVKVGESITFTNDADNGSGVRYYWVMEDQKSTRSEFEVSTSGLQPGKYRVLVTVTNKDKEQAHALAFFEVVAAEADGEEEKPAADNEGEEAAPEEASASPAGESGNGTDSSVNKEDGAAQNSEEGTAQNDEPATANKDSTEAGAESTGQNSQQPGEDSAVDNSAGDKDVKADTTGQSPPRVDSMKAASTDRAAGADTEAKALVISPGHTVVKPGDKVAFSVNDEFTAGYDLEWKFFGQLGTKSIFLVDTGSLTPGSYPVYLTATNSAGEVTRGESTLVIRSAIPELIPAPELTDQNLAQARQTLERAGLSVGAVSEKEITGEAGKIIEQYPGAGEQIAQGASINLVVGKSSAIAVPELLGRNAATARRLIEDAGFVVGKITQQESSAVEPGVVLSQQPDAGAQINKGASIDFVVAKEMVKPLDAIIQPAISEIDQGDPIEFSVTFTDPSVDKDLTFAWSAGDQKSSERQFKVDTLSLEPGKHTVKLQLHNARGQQAIGTAQLQVKQKTLLVPYLIDLTLEQATAKLADNGLQLGEVESKEAAITSERILDQHPNFGERVIAGTKINLSVLKPKAVEPDRITLDVDKKSIKVGDSVIFTSLLTPERDTKDVLFVYTINGQKMANVQPQLTWTPDKAGEYTVIVSAQTEGKGKIAEAEPVSIQVEESVWESPVARILPEMAVTPIGERAVFTSASTYDLNSKLEFDWFSETGHSGSKKDFAFDTLDLQPGTYKIGLTVTDSKAMKSEAQATLVIQATTDTESVQTDTTAATGLQTGEASSAVVAAQAGLPGGTASANEDAGKKPNVELTASRKVTTVGQKIKIQLSSDKPIPEPLYYFQTGDGDKRDWDSQPSFEHAYSSFGAYTVRAAVKSGDEIYYSDSISIWVWSPILFLVTAGMGAVIFGLMWWWTKRIPGGRRRRSGSVEREKPKTSPIITSNEKLGNGVTLPKVPPEHDTLAAGGERELKIVREEAIALKSTGDDIVTEKRVSEREEVKSAITTALWQFTLGLLISAVVIYFILKAIGLK